MTNQTSPKSFILHTDSLDILDDLTDEQAGKLFKSIRKFQKTGEFLETDPLVKIAISPFISQFKRDFEKWSNVVERNKANIAKRWNTKNTTGKIGIPEIPVDTKNTYNKNDSKNENRNNNKNKNEIITLENDFAEFWQFYTPTKTKDGDSAKGSKKVAWKKYEIVRRKHSHQQIMQKLEKYLRNCQANGRFTKMAETWLNQEDFDDNSDEVYIEAVKQPTNASDARQQANESSSEKFLNSDAISIFSDKFQL